MDIYNENTRVEYKELLTKDIDLEKEVIAFLNYKEGGYIYIGVDKRGAVVGVSDIDGDMLKIKDRIKHNISPSAMGLFDVTGEEMEGKMVIKITVASGSEKPYFKTKYGMTSKGASIRIGTASEPMEQNMIDNLFASRVRNSIGRITSNRQELSFSQLRIYYDEKNKTLNDNFKKSLELLVEDDKYNYVAYLMADDNGNSVKLAKYESSDKCDLIENNEYGYCSLVKAAYSVLTKLEIENKTPTKIAYPTREDNPLWNRIALREAVINAFVHNDYTFEIAPTFEIFPDRLEITTAGRLPDTMTLEEFYTGTSVPRNKEIMRIFKDLELVESLGTGIPRIVKAYGRECFKFSHNFMKMVFPITEYGNNKDTIEVPSEYHPSTIQVPSKYHASTTQVLKLIEVLEGEMNREELQSILGLSNGGHFRKEYLRPAIEIGLVELTIPDKPTSSKQRYRLTNEGLEFKAK